MSAERTHIDYLADILDAIREVAQLLIGGGVVQTGGRVAQRIASSRANCRWWGANYRWRRAN